MSPWNVRRRNPDFGSPRKWELFCIMKNDAESVAIAFPNRAYAVTHRGPIKTASATNGPVTNRENHHLPLLAQDGFSAGLSAGPLLHQEKFTALVIPGGTQENSALK